MSKQRPQSYPNQSLIPLPAAVDLIRFEKNLLQIGFFGAHDTRHHSHSTRRIEQWVTRNGERIRVAAEFRSSSLGLPSTSDRDKYIAFMKIAMDQRVKLGRIENPVRFTGYQLLKELGLTYSGENYEDINRWGQRLADTTITSEQVIYLAARKKYANKTVHVFRSFLRAGQSELDESGRTEHYEVVLEDWLLENLNQSYVIPEDFNAYRQLKRPTAKGIFGYLHLWFHASQGRPVEKDYGELCVLLNIPAYQHVSKIKETMGRSLDELTVIGYLSSWDVRRMVSKEGFKLVLMPGDQLRQVLTLSERKIQRAMPKSDAVEDSGEAAALRALIEQGVNEEKAQSLLRLASPATVLEQIEYASHLMSRDRRGKFENPAGFIIYSIENNVPIPKDFTASRRTPAQPRAGESDSEREAHRIRLEEQYGEFVRAQVEDEVKKRFDGDAFAKRIELVKRERVREEPRFARMSSDQQREIAEQMLRREVGDSLPLPSFEEWNRSTEQMNLFADVARN
jgi:hypothetical protein